MQPMSCCGTVSDSRNGSIRTSVTTFVACMPEEICSPTATSFSATQPSNGARIVVSATAFSRIASLAMAVWQARYACLISSNAWR